jgi:hypothetical protein
MGISKADIVDLDIVDSTELAATGVTSYRTGNTVTSTTSGTKVILFPGSVSLIYGDDPVEVGDKVVLTGTSGANGTYTVANVLTDQSLDVVEAIATSTGGTAAFRNKSGALRVGVDTSTFVASANSTAQAVLKDLDTQATAHASQHYVGGIQPITAQNLSSGAAPAGRMMQSDGAGNWNLVTVVAGVAAELNRVNSLVLSTTTSATFITKLTLTTTSLPVGDYILFWSYITNGSNNNTQVESRVRKDGATNLFLVVNKASTAGSQFSNSGHSVQVALSGVHTFTVDYRFAGGSGSAGIQDVYLTLWLIDN